MSVELDNPQIVTHVQKSLNYTLFDAKFIPRSARFVCLGSHAKVCTDFARLVITMNFGSLILTGSVLFNQNINCILKVSSDLSNPQGAKTGRQTYQTEPSILTNVIKWSGPYLILWEGSN